MPFYDYRCRTCDATFEVSRPIARVDDPATCPDGHNDVVRLLPVFSARTAGGDAAFTPAATRGAARGCGGGCACH